MKNFRGHLFYVIMILTVSACSTDFSGNRSNVSMPILSENKWQAKGYPFNDRGISYCVVDGGHNSIRLVLEIERGQTSPAYFISSTRPILPGTKFSLISSDHNFKLKNKELASEQSKLLIKDLVNGQTIYLIWSEPHGGEKSRLRFTNSIKLKDFSAPYKECLAFVKQQNGEPR